MSKSVQGPHFVRRSRLATAWAVLAIGVAPAVAIPTATFENLKGQFLGFGAYTDPLSGIRFNNFKPQGGLGASYFNNPRPDLPPICVNNTLLIENVPQSNGTVSAGWDFSVHGFLPSPVSFVSADALYIGQLPGFSNGKAAGSLTLNGYNSAGQLVASGTTGVLSIGGNNTWFQTNLWAGVPGNATTIVSFDLVDDGLASSYDNIAAGVPEPAGTGLTALALLLAGRRRRRAGTRGAVGLSSAS